MRIAIVSAVRSALLLSAVGVALVSFVGCKADEAPSAGFVNKDVMQHDASLPFHRVWKKPGYDPSKYTQLYVAPVNTSYMLKMTDWQTGMKKDDIERDVAKLAMYTQETIKKAFREDPNRRVTIVESYPSSPNALVLEVALVEVVPSKVVLNALGYTPFYIGTTITAARSLANDVSTVAAEVRIRDAVSGEVVAMIADREAEQVAPASVRGMTWYGHAETIIKQWATQMVQAANRKPGETVKDTDAFTLKPW